MILYIDFLIKVSARLDTFTLEDEKLVGWLKWNTQVIFQMPVDKTL